MRKMFRNWKLKLPNADDCVPSQFNMCNRLSLLPMCTTHYQESTSMHPESADATKNITATFGTTPRTPTWLVLVKDVPRNKKHKMHQLPHTQGQQTHVSGNSFTIMFHGRSQACTLLLCCCRVDCSTVMVDSDRTKWRPIVHSFPIPREFTSFTSTYGALNPKKSGTDIYNYVK